MSDMAERPEPSAVPMVPLAGVPTGQQVRLMDVRAGHDLRARLAGMGLLPGMKLTVVRNNGGGPLVVLVHNTRLALGRGMVHRMLVAPLEPGRAAGGAP